MTTFEIGLSIASVLLSAAVSAWVLWIAKTAGRDVLSITPLYFELTSGIDRFLYRLARRHAGNGLDHRNGWAFSFWDLHKRSGSSMRYADFERGLHQTDG